MSKISIIIPTYRKFKECLKPCLESIIQHTDLQNVEVIVVANGCKDDGTREFVEGLGHPFRLLWIEEAAGFTYSVNRGIKIATGDYIVLLNNDTIITGGDWLNILVAPFEDPLVAATGPAKNWHKETQTEFLFFFCTMIKRSVINALSLPDEIFNPGYGEDIEYAIRIKRAGLKSIQVPVDTTLSDTKGPNLTGPFPIYHKGSVTVHEVPTWSEVVPRNEAILLEKAKPQLFTHIGNILDTIPRYEIFHTVDRIMSQVPEGGQVVATIDDRTSVTLDRGGFMHHCFVGNDGLRNIEVSHSLPDISTKESIKDFVLQCGNKSLWQFGGIKEGGYCIQQDADEVSEYLNDMKHLKIENYLEIGCADGGLTRVFCDVVDVKNVTHMDLGWADANYPFTYRNNLANLRNSGSIRIFRGDSHSQHADLFLKGTKYDFIFIDADHTYDSVVKDTMLAMKHAADGAIFAYHDHISCADEVGIFYEELCRGKFPQLKPIKAIGNKFGISTFTYSENVMEKPNKKYSVIIPTYNHLEDCLKPCLRSIINTTELKDVEVIVVANGCTDGTQDYVRSLGGTFKLIDIPEAVGFIRATNAGIKAASGEYIVLLNNDTEVLNGTWLHILSKPFSDKQVGMTGPYKDWRFFWSNDVPIFREEYMVFYCAMIKREVFDKIGYLDEDFGLGYEEDIDFAVRLKRAGYRIVQVPDDRLDELQVTKEFLIHNPNYNSHQFPVKHKDKMTFKEVRNDPWKKTSLLQKYPDPPMISIVIPSYNNLNYLKKCVRSIIEHTDLKDVEVIIVANGCTDGTREYVHSLGHPFKLYWIDERVGYIRATNAGIKHSMGKFVILLNNDTEITGAHWMRTLLSPFGDPSVGISGPMKAWRDDVKSEYILFWCAAIRREVFEKIGMLDENFGEGYHEDVDFCIRTQRAGFRLVEVPEDISYSDNFKGDPNRQYSFPISHEGGGTFAPIYGNSEERLKKHLHVLYDKYLPKPELPQGWFGEEDQGFHKALMNNIPQNGRMAEIGVWKGLSLCSAAELIKNRNIQVEAIDTFEGSPWEGEAGAWVGDTQLQKEFEDNILRFGLQNNVKTHAMSSLDAAKQFPDNYFDYIFIDGDHRYESVQADIRAWLPKLKEDGIISGHDILWNDSVGPAVWGIFGKDKVYSGANIWYIVPDNRPNTNRGKRIYDCFTFFNELDVLDIRLNEMNDVVDKFVLVEARVTHQGKPKPLYFEENKQRFSKFLDKIEHIVIDDFPGAKSTWDRENAQRNAIERGLKRCRPDDIIILSDADEIVGADVLKQYKPEMGLVAVQMPLFYYKLDWKVQQPWLKPRIFTWGMKQDKNMQWFRGEGDYRYSTILHGGWHFSFLGDKDSIKQKIQSYGHEEFNNDTYTNDQNIEEAITLGRDIFGRNDMKFEKVVIDGNYPKYVQRNLPYFIDKGLVSSNVPKPIVYDCFSFFNELDLLEIRLNELDPYVDYFVISEMAQTHAGQPKPLHFEQNKERFAKFLPKIKYIVPPNIDVPDPWTREHYQRDFLANAITDKKDSDIIIVSDLDEIPRGSSIKEFTGDYIKYFEQNQYSYFLNYNVGISPIAEGTFSRITTWRQLRESGMSMTALRYAKLGEAQGIKNGGWHFSWMGGAHKIIDKLKSWAHQEFNKPELLVASDIEDNISKGKEHFGRPGIGETKKVPIDNTFPKFVQENQEYLRNKGLLDSTPDPKVAIIMPYHNDPTLVKSVSAIIGQTYQNWTLFIVDDGSDIDKRATNILASHPKIKHFEKVNGGPASARNSALDIIGKDFTHIAFCDSDDVWDKNFLVANLSKIGDNDMVYSSVNHVFENGQPAYPYGIPDPDEYPGGEVMLATPFIFMSSVLCRKDAIGFNRFDTQLDSVEDWEMWLRLDKQGKKIIHNPEKLVTYTVKNGMAAKRTDEKVNIIRNRYERQKNLV